MCVYWNMRIYREEMGQRSKKKTKHKTTPGNLTWKEKQAYNTELQNDGPLNDRFS